MKQQVACLHRKWSEYVELFGTKESRIVLLNQTAPLFFRIVQDSMWENVLLNIARLTDPPKSQGKYNLTIRRLEEVIDHSETKATVQSLTKEALNASAFCRDWRNRHIAHQDLLLALEQDAKPLEEASRQKVREALKALESVLNAVSAHYLDSQTSFKFYSAHVGAMSLLYHLDYGLKAESLRRERLESGQYDSNDYEPHDL
jgi:hypothetical protein